MCFDRRVVRNDRLTVLGLAAALLVENVTFPLGMVIRCKDNRFLNPAPKKIGGDNLRLSHGGMPFHMEGIEDCRMRSVLRRKSDCELRLVVSEISPRTVDEDDGASIPVSVLGLMMVESADCP